MEKKHLRTRLAHTGDVGIAKKIHAGVSVPKVLPIYMTSVFSFDDVPTLDAVYEGNADGYVYTRMTNPSTDAVEENSVLRTLPAAAADAVSVRIWEKRWSW